MRFQDLHRFAPRAGIRADTVARQLRAQFADNFAHTVLATLLRANHAGQSLRQRDQYGERDVRVRFQRCAPNLADGASCRKSPAPQPADARGS